ncbi:MAG: hypothetical protein JWQ90_5201 [Hydrocarboniphaga sp.]|uniref:hypothetical protein n=1 Tax=Hydrocarboniphaga sp. TaxID=2033016 RepID=UPI002607B525|nr:hypothetical protein [Hydrocarboniphaga sp.]MDB5972751.1 hypothetical protein [Hydrocarboniphaga sp.]
MFAIRSWAAGLAALMMTVAAVPSQADSTVVIYQTDVPGGAFGYWGSDVYTGQSVGARFTMPEGQDLQFSRLGLYLMNNSDTIHGEVTLSLRPDQLDEGATESLPSTSTVLESWTITTEASGWTPVQQFVTSTAQPQLIAGHNYWVVAESDSPAGVDPIWVFAATGTGWSTTTSDGAWQTAGSAAALTLQVEGTGTDSGTPAPTVSIQSNVQKIALGRSLTLIWNTTAADTCKAAGDWSGTKATSGTQRVKPTETGVQVYKLSCTGDGGRGVGQVKVKVVAPKGG